MAEIADEIRIVEPAQEHFESYKKACGKMRAYLADETINDPVGKREKRKAATKPLSPTVRALLLSRSSAGACAPARRRNPYVRRGYSFLIASFSLPIRLFNSLFAEGKQYAYTSLI